MNNYSVLIISIVLFGFIFDNSNCSNGSKKYNRYLAHIFNKYGTGGSMSFEGLEHLMHNLGLGGLEFNRTHTIDEHHPNGYKIPEFTNEEDQEMINDIDQENSLNKSPNIVIKLDNLKENLDTIKYNNKNDLQIIEDDNLIPSTISDIPYDNIQIIEQSKEFGFKEMHDPKHRHPRHHADQNPESQNKCLSPESILKLTGDLDQFETDMDSMEAVFQGSFKITPKIFMKMCPALLVQIDMDACVRAIEPEHKLDATEYTFAWIYASIAIFIISCCGLIGVVIVPLTKSMAYEEILKFLVAVAVGTLCGDALMHLLPHALIEHDKKPIRNEDESHHDNNAIWLCACAFLTAVFMYSLETLLPLIKGASTHSHHDHSQHHNLPSPMKSTTNSTNINMEAIPKSDNDKERELNIMLDEEKLDKKGKNAPLSPVAFMVILGDGLHNLTDGLAIGAAFVSDPVTGMATALAVLCHELPHELGDFALLLKTGVNINRAIFLNIVSSILSFMGMAIGLIVAGMHTDMVRWIYAGTAGSFLYIALADLIPEMGRDSKKDVKNCLIQIFGILVGGGIMMLIALNEDQIRSIFE